MRPPAALAVLPLIAAALLAAPPASAQASGEGVVVAVLDSGVDSQHPELAGRVDRITFAPVAPGIPLDIGSPTGEDPDGQGTAVASLAAGATMGVAPRARILDLQVSPQRTGTQLDPVSEQAAVDAMDYLLQDPGRADVVILSFTMRGISGNGASTLASQAEKLADRGVLVIVPASPTLSELHLSSAVMTVGAPDCPASSGRQTGDDQPRKPDLVAPSSNLRAAAPGTPVNDGPTTTVSGTAFAAAQVAGAAALLLDVQRTLPVDATGSILRDSTDDRGDPGADGCNGFGLLNPASAVLMAQGWTDPLDEFPTQPTPAGPWLALVGILAGALVLRRRA